jgi:HD-GYP domain-containing protein (c-di-GMP phosphodiesterase class II)
MYVHDLNCNWLTHPFVRNSFPVTTKEQIQKILNAKIEALYIDTEKGLDVDQPKPKPINTKHGHVPEELKKGPSTPQPVILRQELSRAANITKAALHVLGNLIEDVRQKRPINIDAAGFVMDDMVDSVIRNSDALLGLTRIRSISEYTLEHSVGVSVLLITFGKYLGLNPDELKDLGLGGLVHDLGKELIPPAILNKPGKLTPDEYVIMHKHVEHTYNLVKDIPGIPEIALRVVREHHEYYDGTGYPKQIAGDEISLYGQMAAITDIYDAITTDRVYGEAISQPAALGKLFDWGQQKFNQELVQRFIHCIGIYPIGSLVSLSNGYFGVVIESGTQGLLLPRVRVVFNSIRRQFVMPKDVDLSHQTTKEQLSIVGAVDPRKWGIVPEEFLAHTRY